MSTSNRRSISAIRRLLGAVGVAAAVTIGAISIAGGSVSAQHPDQLAEMISPQVTVHAVDAVDALARFDETGELDDLQTYRRHRAEAAILTAQLLGYSEQDMVRAWSVTSIDHQRAVLAALTQLGVPYRAVSSIEGVGFDCSGLTSYAWRAGGRELFRNSTAQINDATRLDRSEARAGDLVQYPGHIMMYLGVDDAIVHSITPGRDVELGHISQRKRDTVRFGEPRV